MEKAFNTKSCKLKVGKLIKKALHKNAQGKCHSNFLYSEVI